MSGTGKKFLYLTLALMMVLTLPPVTASANAGSVSYYAMPPVGNGKNYIFLMPRLNLGAVYVLKQRHLTISLQRLRPYRKER